MTTLEIYANFKKEIDKRTGEINALLSQYDKEESDLLHFLENETYDAIKMMRVAKRIKEVRIKRREIKMEFIQINSITVRYKLAESKLATMGPENYTYRTDILHDIASRQKGYVFKCKRNKTK